MDARRDHAARTRIHSGADGRGVTRRRSRTQAKALALDSSVALEEDACQVVIGEGAVGII